MPKNLIKRNGKLGGDQSGFTIVELIIVIAIAALILVIALAVVPALRRSGRNSARNSDIRAITAQLLEYSSQSGGKVPATDAIFNDAVVKNVDLTHADWRAVVYADTPGTIANVEVSPATIGTTAAITATTATDGTAAAAIAVITADDLLFIKGSKCKVASTLSSAAVNAPASTTLGGVLIEKGASTSVVVIYMLEGDETDGKAVISCLEV